MSTADRIRDFIARRLIAPARQAGRDEITIRAGEVHSAMCLHQSMPSVWQVLAGRKLQEQADVQLLDPRPDGPKANAWFRFQILPRSFAAPVPVSSVEEEEQASLQLSVVRSGTIKASTAVHERRPPLFGPKFVAKGLVLVSCVKMKQRRPARAEELYTSPLFKGMRRLAMNVADWRILSAAHGLVHPNTVIAPYEKTLNTMSSSARHSWAERVLSELLPLARQHGHVVFLAGQRYREHLIPALCAADVTVDVPMTGLTMGQQLAWLGQQP